MSKNFFGFTLAEVLITLGIIGVVAAITMPALIQNYKKHVVVNQLKKAYSEISQAIKLAEIDYGSMETWDLSDFSSMRERNVYFGKNYLLPHIKTTKFCEAASKECWAEKTYNLNGSIAYNLAEPNIYHSAFTTASGYSVYMWIHGNGTGMWYVVDINGLKEPNRFGRDIFALTANWGKTTLKKGIYPAGIDIAPSVTRENIINGDLPDSANGSYRCKKTNGIYAGVYCGALIMLDGWKISDDYPW